MEPIRAIKFTQDMDIDSIKLALQTTDFNFFEEEVKSICRLNPLICFDYTIEFGKYMFNTIWIEVHFHMIYFPFTEKVWNIAYNTETKQFSVPYLEGNHIIEIVAYMAKYTFNYNMKQMINVINIDTSGIKDTTKKEKE